MEINLRIRPSLISFGPIKELINYLSYKPEKAYEFSALKVIYPLKYSNTTLVDETSLTDAAEFKDQIRFSTKDRIERSYVSIKDCIFKEIEHLKINLYHSEHLDTASRAFFEILGRSREAEVIFHIAEKEDVGSLLEYTLTEEEEKIERLLISEDLSENEYEYLLTVMEKYLNCGDSWTTEYILNRLEKHKPTPFIYNMKGLIYTLLDRPVESEYYYQLWRKVGEDIDIARANYSIAMLYLRHHLPQLKSKELGEKYLEEAYQILQRIDNIPSSKLEFEKVFNRNGYALYLFNIGQVDEAIEILKEGISKLNGENKILLHKTVLIYNLAQCYVRLGRYRDAITTYKEVISLDPYFPEYHAELGKCYMQVEEYEKAIEELKLALNYNPTIGELNSLLGFCYQEINQLLEALFYFEKAFDRYPTDFESIYNLAYTLNENKMYEEAYQKLKLIKFNVNTSSLMIEDYFSLLAEVCLSLNKKDEAIIALNEGLSYVKNSDQLNENLNQILTFA